jgi:uncharacterized protein (TIGR00288 family)
MHRGPQAVSQSQVGANIVHAPNAALLIDFDNVTMGIRSDLGHELRNLLGSDIIKGKVAVQRAYADWRRYPQYIVPLAESSIDMIMAPAYGSSKKNATDIRLAIDAMELVFTRPEIGTFILLSGDSDFSSLVMKIKEYGKYVIGVGIRESSSDLLVQNCDEYYSYNALAGLVKSGEVESVQKWDPWQLVTEAITRMVQNHDVMRSDRLKQVMQEIDGSFDEKDLGMSKFSRFCTEAAHKGLIKVTKLENGQMEVAPMSGEAAARPTRSAGTSRGSRREVPAAAVATTTAPANDTAEPTAAPAEGHAEEESPRGDREGRPRRGRRGGRGRKRADGTFGASAAPMATDAQDAPVETPVDATPASFGEGPESTAEMAAVFPVAADEPAVVATPRPRRPRREEAAPAAATHDGIGVSGLRLTRDEAMSLVRNAVAALTTGDESVPDTVIRQKAFELLGRDSESLSERHFSRILRDAHDQDIVDLRRRGDAFEVARAAAAPSVADQLATREQEAKAAEPAGEPAAPVQRGMGARSAPSRGARGGARKAPPADLLMVGVVDEPAEKPAPRTDEAAE